MSMISIKDQPCTLVAPGEGRTLWVSGHPITCKLTRENTHDQFSLFEMSVPPGNGTPPHVHTGIDETFYVLDGTFEFQVGDNVVTGRAGFCAHVPRGTMHGIRNAGITWGRLLNIATPGGIEDLYAELAGVDMDDPENVGMLTAIARKHGLGIVPPDTEECVAWPRPDQR